MRDIDKEYLESQYKGKIISHERLKKKHPYMWSWIHIPRYLLDKHILAIEPFSKNSDLKIFLFTTLHKVEITAKYPTKTDQKGYLLGVMETRAPYPGETHLRKKDLRDGEFSKNKFIEILCNLAGYELEPISI